MNDKNKTQAIATPSLTFTRLREHQTLLSAATKGAKVKLTYPMAKRGQRTIYTTLEDAAELPHYMGTQPAETETCACFLCVLKHGRFGRGRN